MSEEVDPLAWWRKWRGCSSKQIYASEQEAVHEARRKRVRNNLFPYACKYCGQYHLTSKLPRANAVRREEPT